ncbi:unnamed protein product [Lactuca virosa]|uniref:Uncharacterized protein n=1 Tax=Lactuca virosa TaxID=75947 RepID=A0AAU9N1Z8_9ASTR|nr:unnamed protein product [Lactuca virosa]
MKLIKKMGLHYVEFKGMDQKTCKQSKLNLGSSLFTWIGNLTTPELQELVERQLDVIKDNLFYTVPPYAIEAYRKEIESYLLQFEALVVLVHDMGPNWELISDAINSTLQFKVLTALATSFHLLPCPAASQS